MNMSTSDKIVSLETASERRESWRKAGEKLVFTNGCFDLLHLGHVDYLEKSSQLGDRLVLGLNSDASIRRLKGEDRPMVSEYARARVIAALAFVDLVVIFGEDTPLCLIEALDPDILVKGDDYTIKNIVGAEFVISRGGSVQTVPLVPGFSTTRLIEKIKSTC
jgi:rfaE bifunctional protein nucleotidyltransferase chain/domain